MQGSYQSKKEMQVFNFPGVGINDTMEYISKTCIKHGNDICPNFTFLGMILDTLKQKHSRSLFGGHYKEDRIG